MEHPGPAVTKTQTWAIAHKIIMPAKSLSPWPTVTVRFGGLGDGVLPTGSSGLAPHCSGSPRRGSESESIRVTVVPVTQAHSPERQPLTATGIIQVGLSSVTSTMAVTEARESGGPARPSGPGTRRACSQDAPARAGQSRLP